MLDFKHLLERGKDDAEAGLPSQGVLGLLVLGALLGPPDELLAESLVRGREALNDLGIIAAEVEAGVDKETGEL
jgi:hypothetical protein